MTFVSNAKSALPMEAGSIFRLKMEPSVVIHHYAGCGEAWFLSCDNLGLDTVDLKTEYFDEAVANAQRIIGNRLSNLTARFMPIVSDKTEIVLVRR